MKSKVLVVLSCLSLNFTAITETAFAQKSTYNRLIEEKQINFAKQKISQSIKIEGFNFIGNTIYSDNILQESVSQYIGQEISLSAIQEAAETITNLYVKRGYSTSFARPIFGQESNDKITILITEGKIEKIDINVKGYLNSEYVRSRIAKRFKNDVFNLQILEDTISLLKNDRNIDNINIQVIPSEEIIGATIFTVQVEAAPIAGITGRFSNNRSPLIGSNEIITQVESSILGRGDRFVLLYSHTEGSDGLGLNYNIPVKTHGNINIFYGLNSSGIVQDPFDVGIENNSTFVNIQYSHKLINELLESLTVGVRLDRSTSNDLILGRQFQLTRGSNELGELNITGLRFPVQYFWRDRNDIFTIGTELNVGLGGLLGGTTNNVGLPDSNFLYLRSRVEYARIVAPDSFFLIKAGHQISNNSLPGPELISVGGFDSVLGYPSSIANGDNGLFLSAEYRFPIWRNEQKDMRLQLVPSINFGKVWNVSQLTPEITNLFSVGLGLRFEIGDRLDIFLGYSEPIAAIDNPNFSSQKFNFSVTGKIIEF